MAASCFLLSCHGCWLIPLHLLLAAMVPTAGAGSGLGAGDVDSTAGATSWPAPQAVSSTGRRMPIGHQHGQYSPLADKQDWQLAHEILSTDQRRVENIHRRVSETSGGRPVKQKHDAPPPPVQQQLQSIPASSSATPATTNVPASSGSELDTGNYVVAIGLGTPSKRFMVAIDTGSDTSWVQCQPWRRNNKTQPYFMTANSSTYANVSCGGRNCSFPGSAGCSGARNCLYNITYEDSSYSQGVYSQDTIILSNDTIQDFRFGCSHKMWGLFGESAGVMGLGRGKTSLTMQAYRKYKGVFAYCLPGNPTGTGFLRLGPGAVPAPANLSRTPMLTTKGQTAYYVALTGIKVGGHLLPIQASVFSAGPTILDSGTVITLLPPSAYNQLRSAFAADMAVLGYKKAPSPWKTMDTCFNLTGLQGIIPVPTVSLVFGGGATLDVDGSGILYAVNVSQACLAFASNSKDTHGAVIGSTQQKTYSVLYDVGNEVVGFAPGGC